MRAFVILPLLLAGTAAAQVPPVPPAAPIPTFAEAMGAPLIEDPVAEPCQPCDTIDPVTGKPIPASDAAEAATEVAPVEPISVTSRTQLTLGMYNVSLENGVVMVAPATTGEAALSIPNLAAVVVRGTPKPSGYGTVIEIDVPSIIAVTGASEIFPFPKGATPAQEKQVDRSKEAMPQITDDGSAGIEQKNRNMKSIIQRTNAAVAPKDTNLPKNWQSVR